jgi:hypothetical protein
LILCWRATVLTLEASLEMHFALVGLIAATNKRVNTALRRTSYPILSTSPPQSVTMLDVEDFDAVFQGFNYTDGLVQQIQEYQHALGGQTFFERLLDLLKIKGRRFYGP